MENQVQKSSPRDVFMYLLAIIFLYFSAFDVLALLFQYTDIAFPDVLNQNYGAGGLIRFALASLIVIYPVFIWVSRFLHRDLIQNPQKTDIRIRKWLLYFTLFVAALLIIGDLVALVNTFLNGEITTRFLLKVLAVLG